MANKEKQIQIPQSLFVQIAGYFLLGREELKSDIEKGLNAKLDAVIKHDLYTKYKTATTTEEQEQARKEYLDKIGMSQDFRW